MQLALQKIEPVFLTSLPATCYRASASLTPSAEPSFEEPTLFDQGTRSWPFLSFLSDTFSEPSFEEPTLFDQGTRYWPSLSFLSGTFCIFSSSSYRPHHKGSRVTKGVFAVSMLTVVAVFQLGGCTLDGRTPSEIFIETIWHYEVSTTSNFSQWECKAVEIFCRLSQPRMLTLNPIQGGKPINLDDGMCYPADLISSCFYEVNDTNIWCLLGCVLSFIGVVVGLFWKRLHTYFCSPDVFEGRQTKSPEIVPPILPSDHLPCSSVPFIHVQDAPNKEIKELDTGRKSERDKPTATLIKWKQKNGVDATSGNLVNKLKSTSP